MFSEYKNEVVKTYEKKRIDGALPIKLQHPTPAKLRDEWLLVIQENYSPQKDDALLRNFFGQKDNINEYITCIKRLDPDRFRPLLNYLKGVTQDTDEKNIELLACLISYEERPFRLNLKPKEDKESLKEGSREIGELLIAPNLERLNKTANIIEKENGSKDLNNQIEKKRGEAALQTKDRRKYIMMSLSILLIVIMSLFFGKDIFHKDECMYWDGNKYIAISCDIKIPNKNIIALDTFNLKYFQKINAIDTLTSYSIGKTWYLKTDNEIEFFTSNGYHPVHNEKQLKAATVYILNKYAYKKDSPSIKK